MAYYVSIGRTEKRGQYDKPEAEREETAGRMESVPFGVGTIEEAHMLVSMSKSPVWIIRLTEGDDIWQSKGEIEASPMVIRTRELELMERQKNLDDQQAKIDRINAQPTVVTKEYAGVAVTFTREHLDPTTNKYAHARGEAVVSIHVGEIDIYPGSYITADHRIQKAKWIEYYSPNYWDKVGRGAHLVPLAPHLKEIAAVAKQLSIGTYQES